MSEQKITSDLVQEISTEEQQLLSGGHWRGGWGAPWRGGWGGHWRGGWGAPWRGDWGGPWRGDWHGGNLWYGGNHP